MSGLEKMYLEFLFAAYTGIWVVMFGFLYRMLGRARRLERDLALLKDAWSPNDVVKSRSESTPVSPTVTGPSV